MGIYYVILVNMLLHSNFFLFKNTVISPKGYKKDMQFPEIPPTGQRAFNKLGCCQLDRKNIQKVCEVTAWTELGLNSCKRATGLVRKTGVLRARTARFRCIWVCLEQLWGWGCRQQSVLRRI